MKEIYIESKKVHVIGILLSVPIILIFLKWDEVFKQNLNEIKESLLIFDNKNANTILILLAPNFILVIGIIIHEFIHGIFMALFSKNGWKSVRFGFKKNS